MPNKYMTNSYRVPFFFMFSGISFQKDFFSWDQRLSRTFLRQNVSAPLEHERGDCACCPRSLSWRKVKESPVEHSVRFPLITVSHSPFHADHSSLCDSLIDTPSPFILGSEVARPDHMINVSWSSISDSLTLFFSRSISWSYLAKTVRN